MKTFTNELIINCDCNSIDERYDIFQIKSNDKYIKRGSKILDLNLETIESIAFDDGASVFALFSKNAIKSFELQEMVGEDLMTKKLFAHELKPYILARLLLFAMAKSDYKDFAFSNLTGKLYLFKSEWIASSRKTFVALNIDIKSLGEESAKLSCSACTFTQAKLFKSTKVLETYPRYVFSVKGTLKRVFDKADDSYVRKNRSGKKAEVPFLSFKRGSEKLNKSYFLCSIVEQFNNKYDGLATLSFKEKEIERKIEARKDGPFFDKVVELLIGKEINLVNMANATEDADVFEYMSNRIQELLPLTAISISDQIKNKEMNIVLIHNQDYYKENDIPDPYSTFDRSTPVQCVTLEDACYKDSDVIYKTIIKELEIKNEIINHRKILIDNWKSYDNKKSYVFGLMIENTSYFMNVSPSGDFKLIKRSGLFASFKEELYRKLERILFGIKGEEKLIVADDSDNVNVISDSGIIPLPNKELFDSESPRGKEMKEKALAGILDINVYKNIDGSHQYSSGPIGKTLNISIPTAPHIYNVAIQQGEEIVTSLTETLGVQFVKYNSFTVLPYPFKYIREWINMSSI